jgi:integration host factor subunit alpha
VVDLHGARQRSGIEKFGISGEKSNCRRDGIPLRKRNRSGGGTPNTRENIMADLGIARINNDMDASNTLTRADLSDVVHRRLGLSRAESAGVVERVLHHMCHALSEGQNVKISGFGTFILRDKGQRIGRNPKTGVEVPIAPRRVMTFRASQIMRDQIAKG